MGGLGDKESRGGKSREEREKKTINRRNNREE